MYKRLFYRQILEHQLSFKPLLMISGPRQSGKTTFTRSILNDSAQGIYFNWDILSDRSKLLADPYFFQKINRKTNEKPLVIYDEIHKYNDWKNYLKGVYDGFYKDFKFLVSGSGRLDIFNKGGDSLAGRYLLFYFFPLSLTEITYQKAFTNFFDHPLSILETDIEKRKKVWKRLLKFSGFPEVYENADEGFFTLWSNAYFNQIIREDIANLLNVNQVNKLELLFSLLPQRIGSTISINNLAKLLQSAHSSVKNWLQIFENFFLVFSISPWVNQISRSILKEKKFYLFNYAVLENSGARFENAVGFELWKNIWALNALGKGNYSLHYLKNRDGQEVDFLVANNNKPLFIIECKENEDTLSKNLVRYQKVLKVPAIQLVNKDNVYKKYDDFLIVTAWRWSGFDSH
jgi:predicted AAA+ superfamily ATPase